MASTPTDPTRQPSGTTTHPTYDEWAPTWRLDAQVYEGSGIFKNGGAIQPHPREMLDHSIQTRVLQEEQNPDGSVNSPGTYRTDVTANPNPKKPSPKLLERMRLAAYENIAATIIDHKLSALTRYPPTRRVKGENQEHPWLQWCAEDVDGAGTCLDDFMRDAERIAFIFGHAVILMDRAGSPTQTPSTLAEQGQPVLRLYTPLDMPDWIQDQTGALVEAKLFEIAPRKSVKTAASGAQPYRLRIINGETFEVIDEAATGEATTVTQGAHGFGKIPMVILYSTRRALIPLIGQSVLGDPMLHVDLYNLKSELRELLRKQVFSILNIPLGGTDNGSTVDQAKAMLGEGTGTTNVLFSALPAQFLTADGNNVTVYLDVIATCLRTIYRLAKLPFETDTRDAEAEGSLLLKREDMNQVLAGYAAEMESADLQIAELWFRGTHGATWEAQWDRVQPTVSYPETFDVTPFADILEQAKSALALPLGRSKTFMLELSKEMAPKLLTNVSPETMQVIFEELEKLPDPEQERKERMNALAQDFSDPEGGAAPPPPA